MTFVNFTGRSDVLGQHGTGTVAGKVNYYAYIHLINITTYGKAYASTNSSDSKEPRCEGIIIGHICGAQEVNMINVFVPQARVLSRQFNVGVQGLLIGSMGEVDVTLKNWTIGFAERILIKGYPWTKNGGIGTLFAYADEGNYKISNIVMHTRYKNNDDYFGVPLAPNLNVPVVVGGICGYTYQSTLKIKNVLIDFLATYLTNAGLIAGNRDFLSTISIKNVSAASKRYAKSKPYMYRCIYKAPPGLNLTIKDYNTAPYGERHLPTHRSSCKYVWLIPFVEAAYQNAETMISPNTIFPCVDVP